MKSEPEETSPASRYASGDYKFVRDAGNFIEVDGPGGRGFVEKVYIKSPPGEAMTKPGAADNATLKVPAVSNYRDSLNRTISVYKDAPIRQKPDQRSKLVTYAYNGKVTLIAEYNSVYCLVKVDGFKGYMNKDFFYHYKKPESPFH
ncbi:SH3 domain-containing protein [Fibrella sp. ES10-3-2-2]